MSLLKLPPFTVQAVYDCMQTLQWFMANRCLIKSYLATVSTKVSKIFKYWQYCKHAAIPFSFENIVHELNPESRPNNVSSVLVV